MPASSKVNAVSSCSQPILYYLPAPSVYCQPLTASCVTSNTRSKMHSCHGDGKITRNISCTGSAFCELMPLDVHLTNLLKSITVSGLDLGSELKHEPTGHCLYTVVKNYYYYLFYYNYYYYLWHITSFYLLLANQKRACLVVFDWILCWSLAWLQIGIFFFFTNKNFVAKERRFCQKTNNYNFRCFLCRDIISCNII